MKWEKVKLGDLCTINTGKYDANHASEDGSYPFYTCALIPLQTNTYSFEGDLIFLPGNGANVGEVLYHRGRAEAYQRTYVLSNFKLSVKYLYFFLKAVWKRKLENQQYGSATNYIRINNITDLEVPLPPLHIQEQIADTLDKAEALRRKDLELLQKYDALAQSIFYDMFGNESLEVTASNAIKVIGGAAFKSSDFTSTGIPLIRIGTINKGYFDENQLVFLPEEFLTNYARYTVNPGDLLITLTGTVGKDDYGNPMLIGTEFDRYFLNQRVAKITFDKELLTSEYLFYFFKQKSTKEKLTGISRGVRQANISNQDIYDLLIPVPSLEKQKLFSEILSNNKKSKRNLIESRSNVLFKAIENHHFS